MKTHLRISLLTLMFVVIGQAFTASAQIPPFLTPVTYSAPGISMMAVGDINGDGIPDLILCNGLAPGGNGGVSVMFGLGKGKFQAAKQIVAGGSPGFLLVGDFNNDGKLDIAVANEPDPTSGIPPVGGPPPLSVSILLGNGDGTFQPSIDTPTIGARKIATADFNGDGKLDLLVETDDPNNVQVLLNNGNGTFVVSDSGAPAFAGIIGGDFNGDGKQDFIADSFVYLGNGDGTFTLGPSTDGFPYLAADFNGDGILDLAYLFVSDGRFITGEMNLGLPGAVFGNSFIDDFNGYTIIAADFNGDGKMDIFGTGDSVGLPPAPPVGGLGLGRGDGTFSFGGPGFGGAVGANIGTAFPAVGDLDGNGSPDLVIANQDVLLVALNTSGNPPLLARLTTGSTFVVGGATTVTATVSLGGPAPTGGASITLTSSNVHATFPGGKTVKIPAGSQTATFSISTTAVTASTAVIITGSYDSVKQTGSFTVVPAFSISSVSISPSSLIGLYGGAPATGTVTLSGPASDGTVVNLSSSNPTAAPVPASVSVKSGAKTATFVLSAFNVSADTPLTVSATLQGTTRTGNLTVHKETSTVTITKAEYTVISSKLVVEATSSDSVTTLQVFNSITGKLLGSIGLGGGGKFSGQFTVAGPFTSVAVQSSVGGAAVGAVKQK